MSIYNTKYHISYKTTKHYEFNMSFKFIKKNIKGRMTFVI